MKRILLLVAVTVAILWPVTALVVGPWALDDARPPWHCAAAFLVEFSLLVGSWRLIMRRW